MLEKKDYEIIEKLISTAETIYKRTVKLYELEILGKKNSKDYEINLTSIKDNNATFNFYLSKLGSDYQKLLAAYEYIRKLDIFSHLDIANSDLKLALYTQLENKSSIIFAFIKNRFYQKLIEDPKYLSTLVAIDYSDVQDEEYRKAIMQVLLFQHGYICRIIDDVYMLFLTLLKQAKQKTNNQNIIEKLIKLKYGYSLMLPYLHDYLLSKKYTIDDYPYIIHHSLANVYQMDELGFQETKKSIILTIIAGNIELIKYLTDESFFNYKNVTLAIDIDATIRSCLVVADEKTRKTIENMLDIIINELENKTDEYQTIISILRAIPQKKLNDLSLVRIITIGKP